MPEKKTTQDDEKKLNPQITETDIGVRSLRTITIYPLSMADQIKMSDLITEALKAFLLKKDQKDLAFVKFMIDLIKKNIIGILAMVSDVKPDEEDLLGEITNVQASEIAKILYEVNYEGTIKNLKDLFEKVRSMFPSERLLQPSVKDIPSTGLKISTEKPGEKEEPQSDS